VIRRPKFKSHLRVEIVPPDLTFVLWESGHEILQGKLFFQIAPLIDGKNTVNDIAKNSKKLSVFDVQSALLLLESEGYICDSNESMPPEIEAIRDSINLKSTDFSRRLKQRKIAIKSFGNISEKQFASILETVGVQIHPKADFTVVLTDNYLREELKNLNQRAILNKKPWMIVKPVGNILWLGPVFDPPGSACWACLSRRLRENQHAERFIEKNRKIPVSSVSVPIVPPIRNAALNLAAMEVLKYMAGGNDDGRAVLMTLDVRDMNLQKHVVTKLEDCPECGKPKLNKAPSPIRLKNGKKIFTSDGGHRSFSPDQTFQKLEHHISPLTGIVKEVKFYHSDPNNLIHTCSAGHLFLSDVSREKLLKTGLVQKSAGKE
jgi:ribosomal protein S12 methylthiotransferase accessory factor